MHAAVRKSAALCLWPDRALGRCVAGRRLVAARPRRQLDETGGPRNKQQRIAQRGRRRHESPGAQVEPAAGRSDRRRALPGARPDLVLDDESRAVLAQPERRERHCDRFIQPDLAEVLQLVLADDRPDCQSPKLVRRKSVVGEERQAHVRGEIQVRRVRQVTVEVHRAPPREELPGVPAVERCRRRIHVVTATTCAWIFPSTAPFPNRCRIASVAISVTPSRRDGPRDSISLRSGVPWQYAIAGTLADAALLRSVIVAKYAPSAKPAAERSRSIVDRSK